MKNPTIVPFVKWVGGKRQLLNELKKRLPDSFNNYYEPFIGGGALLMELQPKKAFINDLNKELIDTYNAIKKDPIRVRENLLLMQLGHNVIETFDGDKNQKKKESPFYNKIRAIDLNKEFIGESLNIQDSIYLRAARFIYLNKNTFNGLYRVNQSGHFNSPSKHQINQRTFIWENIKGVSEYLKDNKVTITNKTYDKAISRATKGDFVYLDPPYDYEEGQKGFDAYQKETFGRDGQIDLAYVCKELDAKGVKFMLSNHNTKLVQFLYRKFNIEVVKAKRMVGGKGASRADVEEVIVRNYG